MHNFFVLVKQLGELCEKHGVQVGLAESCTGGGIASIITALPGASAWFSGSAVVYSDTAKKNLLKVPHNVLDQHGAVSEETAAAMANGARQVCSADLILSVTGIAGPAGGTPAKPVGSVCFGLLDARSNAMQTTTENFHSGRCAIREACAAFGLRWLIDTLLKNNHA